jgi:hypothetical protein
MGQQVQSQYPYKEQAERDQIHAKEKATTGNEKIVI